MSWRGIGCLDEEAPRHSISSVSRASFIIRIGVGWSRSLSPAASSSRLLTMQLLKRTVCDACGPVDDPYFLRPPVLAWGIMVGRHQSSCGTWGCVLCKEMRCSGGERGVARSPSGTTETGSDIAWCLNIKL
jgi:hypothetical protein